ncbi:MAG: RluA family pseudouridine synthase [Pontiellaceae bacterium]
MQQYCVEDLSNHILYADNHILAINKPRGILTQASGQLELNVEDWAREWVRVEKNKPGAVFLHAVHRLDRAVSGVVLFARTSKALSRLNQAMREGRSAKIYYACVEGIPKQDKGTCINYILHGDYRAELATDKDPDAKKAILHYKVLRSKTDQALLEVELITGRYHQIRVQLSALGCPIKGDLKYGAQECSTRIGLHHKQLKIEHPVKREPLLIVAPLPADMRWY